MLRTMRGRRDPRGLCAPFGARGSSSRTWPPVPRRWEQCTAILLGSGPSLTQAQVEEVFRLRQEGQVRVVAINTTFRLAPWADLLYACDGKWWRENPDALGFPGLKVTQDQSVEGVLHIPSETEPGLSLDPIRIHQGANGGYQALNLAVLLGAKKIILLGFDMREIEGRKHWHPNHSHGLNNPHQGLFDQWIENFRTTIPDLERAGVEVVNCSPGSALDAFPFSTLRDEL